MFDQIGSTDKKFYNYEDCGHDAGTGDGHNAIMDAFMESHLSPIAVGGTA